MISKSVLIRWKPSSFLNKSSSSLIYSNLRYFAKTKAKPKVEKLKKEKPRKDQFIMAIDQGTTSSRVLLINKELKIVGAHQESHQQIKEHPGWVSHDPNEIYTSVMKCIEEVMKRNEVDKSQILGVGITNQRETTVAWNRKSKKPLHDAIVWLDKRNTDTVERMIKEQQNGDVNSFRSITGLPNSTYFSAAKMKWILENSNKTSKYKKGDKNILKAEASGNLCFGTIDSWLINCLTKGKEFVIDSTNASRTNLMNINTLEWDQEMLKTFNIKQECLPRIVKESSADFGVIEEPILKGVPITGVIGDQQSACLGHTLNIGEVKTTYGTGCFILMNTGTKPILSKNGLLTTVLYKLNENSPTSYAFEGAVECGGATIEWAKNNLGLFKDFKEFDQLLTSVNDNGGVYFVPAFSGLFSPYWRNDARGTILGLSLHSSKGHILRALMNGIFMRCKEVIECMDKDMPGKKKISKIFVDGGVSTNNILMQIQSDYLNTEVVSKKEKEITCIGAGIAAGLKVGFWKDLDEIRNIIEVNQIFKPQISTKERNENETKWKEAINRSLGWI